MLKKTVRIGILLVLVASLMFGIMGTQPARALVAYPGADVHIMNIPWDGSTDIYGWDFALATYESDYVDPSMTVGEYRDYLQGVLGYPVVVLFDTYAQEGGVATVPSDSALMGEYLCVFGFDHYHVYVFKAQPKSSNPPRLTLFGYVNDDGKSCVLWSLDGSRNLNVADKCGGGAELVCTVTLVGKELEYDCEGGYDWLGEQIVNDPQWLEWAHNFASMNGRK